MMPLKDTKEHNLIGLHKRKDRPEDARCLNHIAFYVSDIWQQEIQ